MNAFDIGGLTTHRNLPRQRCQVLAARLTRLLFNFPFNFYHLRYLSFDRVNLGQIFLLCSELEEHHCPHPWSFRSFTTVFLHFLHVLVISSLKNSTIDPQCGQAFSKMESKPHSSVLFPEHLLIVPPCSTVHYFE